MQEKNRAVNIVLVSAVIVAVALSCFSVGALTYGQKVDALSLAPNGSVQEKTLSISGVGTVKAAPDEVVINLGVTTEAVTAEEAVQENAAKMTSVVNAITGVGVKQSDIETSSYSLYPIYKYDPETYESTLIGYRVQNTVTITTKMLDQAGTIIDATAQVGANQVNSIAFQLSDDVQKQLQNEALTLASQNAKGKAEILADALNVKIVGVKTVNIGSAYTPPPVPIYKAGTAEAAPETPILPSEQELTVYVDVVFIID